MERKRRQRSSRRRGKKGGGGNLIIVKIAEGAFPNHIGVGSCDVGSRK
jgi:hypothetical protein